VNAIRLVALLPLVIAAVALSAPTKKTSPSKKEKSERAAPDAPFWTGRPGPDAFQKAQQTRLDRAQRTVDRIVAAKGPRTIQNTLRPYDDALLELDAVSSQASLLQNVHPDPALRGAAEKTSQAAQALASKLSLNRDVYDALASLDVSKADAATSYYVERTLRDFRLAGVSKDEATRKKINALRDELVLVGQEFSRNIRSDVRTVKVKDASELDGLPADYVARHKPAEDGSITLTIDYPDALPVFAYAKNDDLRKRMYMEYNNRAYPSNVAVLQKLIAKRWELANLLGFPTWADYITADKMVKNVKAASDFVDRIADVSAARAEADYKELLSRKQAEVPGASLINAWERSYWAERVRKEAYSFNSQSVRPYFAYERVKQGILDVTSRLFGVTFGLVKDAPVWDPSVECFEMLDGGRVVGRFYLDMHPRKDKYNHAAAFAVRTGVKGRQLPETALVCNFPGGEKGDPGLMEHGDVGTFLHEFGHLLHSLFAQQEWVGLGGISNEQDFVEAPSQMLEEWTFDPATLATFARHHETNEPIPPALVASMKRARDFGKGLDVRRQMVFARLSLSAYDRKPSEVDFDAFIRQLNAKYLPFPWVEGTHFQTAFGHLDGYSAVYYTYMWSLVIAKDLFSRFDKTNLIAPEIARKYRESVLAPGSSAPAGTLVERFLGRPFDFKAWQAWLNEKG
jgi:thimet oligopeptidase